MPDLRRVFVVECLIEVPAEVPGVTIKHWVEIGAYDSESEALAHAKDPGRPENTRVRQFYVQYFDTLVHRRYHGPPSADVQAEDLTDFVCLDHRENKARGFEAGTPPKCPDCKGVMVSQAFADALDDPSNIRSLT